METIIICSQKGRSGKTTLARNLSGAAARDGQRVLCLDLDPQSSLRAWWEAREDDAPAVLDRDPLPPDLGSTLGKASSQFDLTVIDTPPSTTDWLPDALGLADLALVPVRPSPDDLRAAGSTVSAINTARVPFAFVLSQNPTGQDHGRGGKGSGPTWQGIPGQHRPTCQLCRDRRHRPRRHRNNRCQGRR